MKQVMLIAISSLLVCVLKRAFGVWYAEEEGEGEGEFESLSSLYLLAVTSLCFCRLQKASQSWMP